MSEKLAIKYLKNQNKNFYLEMSKKVINIVSKFHYLAIKNKVKIYKYKMEGIKPSKLYLFIPFYTLIIPYYSLQLLSM